MNCPSCGTPQKIKARICHACGEAHAVEDLTELASLRFLLQETSRWNVPDKLRQPYLKRLRNLEKRMQIGTKEVPQSASTSPASPYARTAQPVQPTHTEVKAQPAVVARSEKPAMEAQPAAAAALPAAQTKAAAAAAPPARPATRPAAAPPKPPREKVPFDQWLLSERNIKIALYSGGILLLLAGLIFIGVNWTRIPGPGKFAITLIVTGMMYFGGYLLFRRPNLRIGGIAMLLVASGFLTLNFAVLQIYVFESRGLASEAMWLSASLICLPVYILTAYWTRAQLFVYISFACLVSLLAAILIVGNVPQEVYPLAFTILMIGILGAARLVKTSRWTSFTFRPLIISAYAGTIAAGFLLFVNLSSEFLHTITLEFTWLQILTIGIEVVFLTLADRLVAHPANRWAGVTLFTYGFMLGLLKVNLSNTFSGAALLSLALLYLGIGYWLETRSASRRDTLMFFVFGLALPCLVTALALQDRFDLAVILVFDVLILAATSRIFRNSYIMFGAVWLLMLPVYLFLTLYVPEVLYQGLLIGLLGLIYLAAGAFIARRNRTIAYACLSAAIFMSMVTIAMTWSNTLISTLVLGAVMLLWLGAALIRKIPWLVSPALILLELFIFQAVMLVIPASNQNQPAAAVYAVSGYGLILAGLALRRFKLDWWAVQVYLFGALNAIGGYSVSLVYGGWSAVALSLAFSCVLLLSAWEERSLFQKIRLPPLLTYAGLGVLAIGCLACFDLTLQYSFWPLGMVILAVVFLVISFRLRSGPLKQVFAIPLLLSALVLPVFFSVASLVLSSPVVATANFALLGTIYLFAALVHQNRWLPYGSLLSYLIGFTYLMRHALIQPSSTAQLVMLPLLVGLACLFMRFIAWVLGRIAPDNVFREPLRYTALGFVLIPMLGSTTLDAPMFAGATFGIGFFVYAWEAQEQRQIFAAYAALGWLIIAQFYFLAGLLPYASHNWPVFTAGFSVLLLAAAWLLGRYAPQNIFVLPAELVALGLLIVPAVGCFIFFTPIQALITYSLVTAALIWEGLRRQNLVAAYFATGALACTYFLLLVTGLPNYLVNWPMFSAGFLVGLQLVSWAIARFAPSNVFVQPTRFAGLALIILPMMGSLLTLNPIVIAVTYFLALCIFAWEGFRSRLIWWIYPATGSLLVFVWAVLIQLGATEPQAFILPTGFALLGLGWVFRLRGNGLLYQAQTIAGLLLLMGSAFAESLWTGEINFALLLAVESIVAFVWGIASRSRCYVQIGTLAFIANAFAQFGPAFVDLPRWVQLGLTGVILFAGGLAALFKRDQILNTRERLTSEWRAWNA
ncbi:MAG: DUF2157 domain-containing protein [Anaerolineales bacterium]